MAKIFYTNAPGASPTFSSSTQIIPAPTVSVSTAIDYSSENNQTIVGHKHILTLTGQATAFRKINENDDYGPIIIEKVLDNINKIKNLLSKMGLSLYIRNDNNQNIMVCIGAKLISFDINESTNNWKSYAEYTAQIEFQSIDYVGDDYECLNFIFNASNSPNAVDVSKYKLKEYNESYDVNIQEDLYNFVSKSDVNEDLNMNNHFVELTYTVGATGKNFFVKDKLLPAWEQAKNFVQDKLFSRINALAGVLGLSGDTACDATDSLSTVHKLNSSNGILSSLSSFYSLYNEEISCETSESEGSFSATYRCVIQKNSTTFKNTSSRHTISKNIDYDKSNRFVKKISINGNIEGLISGGIVFANNGLFKLPNIGNLIISGANSQNKYSNALLTLNAILNAQKNDLIVSLKDKLGINQQGLEVLNSACNSISTENIKPIIFNLTHNPFDGTINYNIEYSSDFSCGDSEFNNISISVTNPITIYNTFVIPGAKGTTNIGTVLQNLGTKTAQRIDFTIQGQNELLKKCCLNSGNVNSIFSNICQDISIPESIVNKLPNPEIYVLKTKNKTTNFVDGSYTINLGYLCKGCG
jgi:hypothetical protein